jgi:cell shape-determining protein MreD
MHSRLTHRTYRTHRTHRSALLVVVVGLATVFALAACAGVAGPNNVAHVDTGHISGFWAGLWQGIIMPIVFIVSLFNHNVNIYDVHNNGGWYNFGFVLGACVLLGAGHRSRPRRR